MSRDASHSLSRDAIERAILEYVRRELLTPDVEVDRDSELLTDGWLNSMGALRLATWVDEAYGLDMQPTDFVISNFASVAALARYVERARGGDDGT